MPIFYDRIKYFNLEAKIFLFLRIWVSNSIKETCNIYDSITRLPFVYMTCKFHHPLILRPLFICSIHFLNCTCRNWRCCLVYHHQRRSINSAAQAQPRCEDCRFIMFLCQFAVHFVGVCFFFTVYAGYYPCPYDSIGILSSGCLSCCNIP